MNRFLYPLMVVLAFASIISCQEKEPDTIPVEAVAISQSTAEMVIGDHIQLKALISPSNATEKDVIWSSSNQRVATVSEDGYVEALAKGTTNINALADGLSATCRVTVSAVSVESIILNKSSLILVVNHSEKLEASIKPSYATDQSITWSTSNSSVASCEDGMVTAKQVGEATITAKTASLYAECQVIVTWQQVEYITLSNEEINMVAGESETLTATINPDDASFKTIYWSVLNTASDNDFNPSSFIYDSPWSVIGSFDGSNWTYDWPMSTDGEWYGLFGIPLKEGDEFKFRRDANWAINLGGVLTRINNPFSVNNQGANIIVPEDNVFNILLNPERNSAILMSFDGGSYNTDVFSLTYEGNVATILAEKAGEGFVMAYAYIIGENGEKLDRIEAKCKVTITEIPVEIITLNQTSLTLKKGDVYQLTASVKPDNASNKTVTWNTTDESVVSITQNGLITATGSGICTINAVCGDCATSCHIEVSDTGGLCIEAIESGNVDIKISTEIDYSYDGIHWTSHSGSSFSVPLNANEHLYLRGNNDSSQSIGSLFFNGKCYVYGNIMSMISKKDYDNITVLNQSSAFRRFFVGNTNLYSHPTKELLLPAQKLSSYCYYEMFSGCTSLERAPKLPAMDLGSYCYYGMFSSCANLISAPQLPAENLQSYCYAAMFNNCISLKEGPELPSLNLKQNCYSSMFSGCSKLVSPPQLPATILAQACYESMFSYCTSLTTAPTLPAIYGSSSGYSWMFLGCSSLNYIKALLLSPGNNDLRGWLDGISPTGTFVKNKDMSATTLGIPTGWTVIDAE